jgi:hypothetical protein
MTDSQQIEHGQGEDHPGNRKRVQCLMRTMGLAGQCPKRNLSLAN